MTNHVVGSRVFVIAEAGVNHNGKLAIAKRLVDAAKDIGCDAIKFQTFKTENLVSKKAQTAPYQKRNISNHFQSQFDLIKALELSYKDFIKLKEYCDKH